MSAAIEIPRDRAGLVMQALQRDADRARRSARLRQYAGAEYADTRARLRQRAVDAEHVAAEIGEQLRAER